MKANKDRGKNRRTEHKILDKSVFLYLAYTVGGMKKKLNPVPELLTILEPDQLLVLSKALGGTLIRFPTLSELTSQLRFAVYLYYTRFEGLKPEEVIKRLDLGKMGRYVLEKMATQWEKYIEETGINLDKVVRGYYNDQKK